MLKYIKSYKLFLEDTAFQQVLSFDSIVGKYVDVAEFNDYHSKFIITKFLETALLNAKDTAKASLETLDKYADVIFTQENINKIRDYKNSEWIKALDIKLDPQQVNYPNVVMYILKEKNLYKFGETSLVTTNIRIFKSVLKQLSDILPPEIKFNFMFKGLTEVTDKNFLKFVVFNKETIFSVDKIEEYKNTIAKFLNYSQRTEDEFVAYLLKQGIKSRRATIKEDVKGIDVIDDAGLTYQVKAPNNIKVVPEGYFIPNSSQLDIKHITKVDKLVFYMGGKFAVIDTKDMTVEQKSDGLLITVKPKVPQA